MLALILGAGGLLVFVSLWVYYRRHNTLDSDRSAPPTAETNRLVPRPSDGALAVAVRPWLGSGYETPESEIYFGLSRIDAVTVAKKAGIETIRVMKVTGGAATADFNRRRLNLLIENDIVIAAAFF